MHSSAAFTTIVKIHMNTIGNRDVLGQYPKTHLLYWLYPDTLQTIQLGFSDWLSLVYVSGFNHHNGKIGYFQFHLHIFIVRIQDFQRLFSQVL